MSTKVAALIGKSGSGKTTILCELITQFVAEGKSVAAIKHTHHPLNFDDRGDTSRFRAAGAEPVILAGGDRALIGGEVVPFREPRELLSHCGNADIVLIEGFKHYDGWPRIEVTRDTSPREVRKMIDP